MRAVIQRVSAAKVNIGERVKGAIQTGLLVLLAIEETDTVEEIEWLSGMIVRLRIFDGRKAQGYESFSTEECDTGKGLSGEPVHVVREHEKRKPPFLHAFSET